MQGFCYKINLIIHNIDISLMLVVISKNGMPTEENKLTLPL